MANPWAGEVTITVNGIPHVCKLTLGALAELEDRLGEDTLVALVQRFESGAFASRDVMALIVAGLRGGGWSGTSAELLTADIGDGPVDAARIAAQLLARAFGTAA
ncbi:hypothetical protein FHS72_001687 [Loktanella ponticola]|uniref:Gene transfer agent family protein n=1 Tax=Yoonia ponticola TaxID=1524255 RepID=A0A7W9EXT6_9RHOB|nr:gene transfer agent family protein [Yoonia ponticola]MBB5722063.1 hypothetical protein [Yoonia ponticola]